MSKKSRSLFIFFAVLDIIVLIVSGRSGFIHLYALATSEASLLNLFYFTSLYSTCFALTLLVSAYAQFRCRKWLLPFLLIQFPGRLYLGFLTFQSVYWGGEKLPYSWQWLAITLFVLAMALEGTRLLLSAHCLKKKNEANLPTIKKYILLSYILILSGGLYGGWKSYEAFFKIKGAHLTSNPEKLQTSLDEDPEALYKSNEAGETLLHEALIYGNNSNPASYISAKLLIEKGADLTVKDRLGNTALHYAVINLELTKLLLLKGANINILNNASQSPLHKSVEYNAEKVYFYLLNQGAEITQKDKDGKTAPELALHKKFLAK